ncbi:putative oxidoreductase [Lachnellula arida]|uniref:Putative oxidoreductase n=1 Tax=Lachnellula arida TaxID=1316785 RepID=A0A8T9B3R5_9HELO|nr:putative oxidoreductase [Lachnellula arida]
MPSYLITGASRGLGLGFANELLKKKDNTVIATARNTASSPGLQNLKQQHPDGRLILLDLDVMSADSIKAAAEATDKLLPGGLDNLISNAGVNYNGLKAFDELIIEDLQKEINFNTTSQLLLLRALSRWYARARARRSWSSPLDSDPSRGLPIRRTLRTGTPLPKQRLIYKLVRKYSAVLKNEGITTALLHPSWVGSTDIGNGISDWMNTYAPDYENLSLETSSANCMKVLDTLTPEANGEFFNHDGTKLAF